MVPLVNSLNLTLGCGGEMKWIADIFDDDVLMSQPLQAEKSLHKSRFG